MRKGSSSWKGGGFCICTGECRRASLGRGRAFTSPMVCCIVWKIRVRSRFGCWACFILRAVLARPMKTTDTQIENSEQLSRQLTVPQLSMIAIGGAIGTGLFLGSSLAVRVAGPGVIFSYLIGAAIALLFMGALSEMAVAHPTAGSFGVYAELYLNAWSGFTVRYTYWAAQCIAIGGEATAIAIYCQWWFPGTPKWMWILGFSLALLYVNARSVGSFGSFEYWFSMIKVVAIVLFVCFGLALLAGFGPAPAIGFSNFTAHGGFLPHGWRGVWMAMVFVIFSYVGTEVISVTA